MKRRDIKNTSQLLMVLLALILTACGKNEEGMVYISEELLNSRPNSKVLPKDIVRKFKIENEDLLIMIGNYRYRQMAF